MKTGYFISILLTVIWSFSCSSKNEISPELQTALKNFSTSSYQIVVDISCRKETFSIVIDNGTFFNILLQRGLVKDQEDYSSKIIEILKKNKKIFLENKDWEMIKSYSVPKDNSLEYQLKNDSLSFVNKYFENHMFRSKAFSFSEEKAVIYYLFKKGIYCKRDCITGYTFLSSPIMANKPQ